jgi:hypothetical protein
VRRYIRGHALSAFGSREPVGAMSLPPAVVESCKRTMRWMLILMLCMHSSCIAGMGSRSVGRGGRLHAHTSSFLAGILSVRSPIASTCANARTHAATLAKGVTGTCKISARPMLALILSTLLQVPPPALRDPLRPPLLVRGLLVVSRRLDPREQCDTGARWRQVERP